MGLINSSQPSHVKFQTAFMIAGKLTAMLATFGVPLILIRLLTKSEYGIFAQFYVVVFLCTGIFNLSVQSNLYYFYPTANDQTRKSLITQTLIFLIFVAALAVGLISIPKIGNLIIGDGDLLKYKNYILIGILLYMPIFILEPLYVVKKDVFTSLIYPPTEVLVRLSLVIGLVVFRPGLNSIFSGIIISATVCVIFVLYYAIKEIGVSNLKVSLLNKALIKKQLQYSIPFGVAVSLNLFFQQFDKIICISFLTSAEFAIYAIAFYGIPGVLQIFDSLTQVYLIQMTVKYQENKITELADIYKLLVAKTYSFSLPAMLIVMLYAKKIIILLFTNSYIDAVPFFRAYIFSTMIYMLSSGIILRATSKTNYTLRSYVYSGIVILPLTYFLVKHIGMWGAMTGALVSISLPRFINLAQEIKLVKSNFIDFFPWKQFGKITIVSGVSIIPFVAFEYYLDYGVIVTMLLGVTYIVIVALLEMKYNLLPMDNSVIKSFIKPHIKTLKRVFYKVI
ncbi:lipopolysaccharide biosynthesis protein [Marinilabiliaceae bacterium JC017]|nr:lipopolysaccharide biosynthesis protein [Marinilabiliaceae bacterium JC017]